MAVRTPRPFILLAGLATTAGLAATGVAAAHRAPAAAHLAPAAGHFAAAGPFAAAGLPAAPGLAAAPRAAPAQDIVSLPPERRIDWTLAGIPGGIPVRKTVCATVDAGTYGQGTTDATTAIQSALDACPPGEVVVLPPGTYATSDTIHLRTDRTLRGGGPDRTVIRYQRAGTRSVLDMRGSVYWETYGVKKVYGVPGGAPKDARRVTLSATDGLSVGDLLLLDQRNDGTLVDSVGSEGACTYCSREDGMRARGQYAEVVAIEGNVVELNLPLFFALDPALSPEAVRIRAASTVRRAGVEDLALTQVEPVNDFIVEMDGAQYCWLRNVDVSRMKRRGVWHVESLQNEIRDCVFREAAAGYGRDRGYGLQIDAQSTATLVENNVCHAVDGGGIMTSGGAIGNVIGYNYLPDIRFDDPWWLIGGPSINHSTHPSMNLWEGNIGPMVSGDFIHGSSSHQTVFRCRSAGWKEETATANNNAVDLQYKNAYMTVMGCVLGTPGRSDTYEVAWPSPRDNARKTIWLLGYGGPGGAGDPNVRATLLRHGNWDSVTDGVVWDPAIAARRLPDSLYRSGKPEWWGNLRWPPIGPDLEPMVGKIPAQLRYERSVEPSPTTPPATGAPTASAVPTTPPATGAPTASAVPTTPTAAPSAPATSLPTASLPTASAPATPPPPETASPAPSALPSPAGPPLLLPYCVTSASGRS
jgi:hypothetical protein